ncbi:hypothetical protein D0Z07_3027 [Hyphodiscus hymeniophilus]|uniref:Uncharacterized protein n=1 Tax=Hyphodiscus hymeniophilus TaxID=353542 RepID=A0A9P7AY45_9HELO|nr:hypothetical protein D0Z07_3027 [Hyphodiscus hymeniophilus]
MSHSGFSSSHAGMVSDSVGGIPNNTTTADPQAAQAASSNGPSTNTTDSHGPAVSTNYNNVERVPAGSETGSSSGNKGGVKGVAAAVHGLGEKVRGTFNKGVDDAAHDSQGSAKNSSVANAGDSEIASGKFAASTKQREGLLPGGEQGQRHAQANTDLNRE